jgi:hypothetical protein
LLQNRRTFFALFFLNCAEVALPLVYPFGPKELEVDKSKISKAFRCEDKFQEILY